jgi:hypothetical protein
LPLGSKAASPTANGVCHPKAEADKIAISNLPFYLQKKSCGVGSGGFIRKFLTTNAISVKIIPEEAADCLEGQFRPKE